MNVKNIPPIMGATILFIISAPSVNSNIIGISEKNAVSVVIVIGLNLVITAQCIASYLLLNFSKPKSKNAIFTTIISVLIPKSATIPIHTAIDKL